jgi:thioesterase domain-containing protein
LDSSKAVARARFGRHADAQLATLEDEREQVYDRAAQRYATHVRSFPGSATLITAGERLREQPLEARDCGFGPHVQALEVRLVDCDHIALVEEPHISEVADIFLRALARTGERRSRNTLSIVPSVGVPISS